MDRMEQLEQSLQQLTTLVERSNREGWERMARIEDSLLAHNKTLARVEDNLLVQAQLMDRFERETRARIIRIEEQVDRHTDQILEFRATTSRLIELLEQLIRGQQQGGNGHGAN